MADATTIFFLVLHILKQLISWPLIKLTNAIIILLSPFYNVITFILLPFVHLGRAVIGVLSIPFTVKWLERIETLYVYLGTAALVGCITGTIVFAIFKVMSSSLNIDATIVPKTRHQGRTTAEYRAARRVKKEGIIDHSPSATPVVLKKVAGPRRRGLLSQAIMEEEDSDF
ncbi:hypothetical protein BDW02DRAFT_272068 [Decorospora gaudefroyi]|uniref:Uncharacterized protein n=1 Tax=Decorospora gaudefroyi TaxID=184978 RepID=A0A6A5KKM9_9PLEO|nr:hypothetical protein BDW02DRAFT_272068 [Decorospora gaudefroyi]